MFCYGLTMDALLGTLLDLLACPHDQGALHREGATLRCERCARHFPIDPDGIISFLPVPAADASGWDDEAEAYAAAFTESTEAMEVAATVQRIGAPQGPVLDHGAGTGRMTAALHRTTHQPVIALDYSRESLRRLVADCAGLPVLALHADVRALPLRDGALAAACSAGVHPLLRDEERRLVLAELARVVRPDAPVVLSTLNYSWVFRAWRLKGNTGARQGEHLHGRDIHYRRFTTGELTAELRPHFAVTSVVGVRNIPVRTVAAALRSIGGRRLGPRLAAIAERVVPRLDHGIGRLRLSRVTGFLLLATATRAALQERVPAQDRTAGADHPAGPDGAAVPKGMAARDGSTGDRPPARSTGEDPGTPAQ